MSNVLTVFIILILIIMSLTITENGVIRRCREQHVKVYDIAAFLIVRVFEVFGMISLFRLLLMKGSSLESSSGSALVVSDILASAVFCFIFRKDESDITDKRKKIVYRIMAIVVVASYICELVNKLRGWDNHNAAIFRTLRPEFAVSILVAIILVFCVVNYDKLKDAKALRHSVCENISVCAVFVVTVLFLPLASIVLTNAGEFDISAGRLISRIVIVAIVSIVILTLILIFFDEKIRRGILISVFGISICSYVQASLLNSHLFLMDGKELQWNITLIVTNILIVTLIFIVIVAVLTYYSKYASKILIYVSCILIAMQLVGFAASEIIYFCNADRSVSSNENHDFLSDIGIEEVATDENIVVFVLDTFDTDYFNEAVCAPDIAEGLSDCVYYPDIVTRYSRTYPSVPYMFSGEDYQFDADKREYKDRAFTKAGYWQDLIDSGYRIYTYEQDELCIGEPLLSQSANYVEKGTVLEERLSFTGILESMFFVGGYEVTPYAFKNCYLYTSEILNDCIIAERVWDYPDFKPNDAMIYDSLRENGLTLNGDKRAIRLFHLSGAHGPYTMDENGEYVPIGGRQVTLEEQSRGSLRYVISYMEQLKELGLYDDAMIVITADHGENFVADRLSQATNPILLIKYPHSNATEITISDVPATQPDIMATVLDTIGMKDSITSGQSLRSKKDTGEIRVHRFAVVDGDKQIGTIDYEIDGDASVFDNWHVTDVFIPYGEYY